MDSIVFTPSAVLSLLSEIEELKGQEIVFDESAGSITFKIGDSSYTVDVSSASTVEVDDETIDKVEEANEEGYSELSEVDNITVDPEEDEIQGGIIKELLKTLAVGGLVRLTKKAIMNS